MELIGRTLLGKYEIKGLLGQGGMGAVYHARHSLTGRKLAIKVLDDTYLDNGPVVQRFGREARAASAIQHPGIVEVLDLDQSDDGIPFLVMEYLEGETLGRRIERRGRLSQAELLHFGKLLLHALSAAHEHGVVHRDLKPDNIYVVPAGHSGEVLKILDFGISQKADEKAAKLTMTGSVLGTPHYMSPEQAMGDALIDHRADLYAVGVVLYECAVGDVPYDAPNYNRLLRTILDEQPTLPKDRGAQINDEIQALILWGLEKDRDKRPQAAQEMLYYLQQAEAGHAPPYTPPGPAPASALAQVSPRERSSQDVLQRTMAEESAPSADDEADPFASAALSIPEAPVLEPRNEPDPVGGGLGMGRGGLDLSDSADLPLPDLELDESAMRPASEEMPAVAEPPLATPGTTGTTASVTGRYSVPPRISASHTHLPMPPAEGGGRLRTALRVGAYALGAGLVFVGLVYGLRGLVGRGEVFDDNADLGTAVPQNENRASNTDSPNTRDTAASPSRWVSIRVEGVPAGGRLLLDGLPASSPLRVRRGGQHRVEVTAAGYVDQRLEFEAERNMHLRVEMQPVVGVGQPMR